MHTYNLKEKAHNGYIFAPVTKGMHGIPQVGRTENYSIVKHLEPYGYRPSIKPLGLWTQKIIIINFTLVVDNSGVKYLGKEHSLHLKASLEYIYKFTTD